MDYINKTVKFRVLTTGMTQFGIIKEETDKSFLIETGGRITFFDKRDLHIVDILLDGKSNNDNVILG